MEIILDDLKNLNKEFKKLTASDWLKVYNTNLNVAIVITKKYDKLPFPFLYNDIAIIYFECEDKFSLYRNPEVNKKNLHYYINLLLKQNNIHYMEYIVTLMKHELKINDVIIFENGKKGIILLPKDNYRGSLHYKLIKKDGNLGVKELTLYAGKKFKIEDNETK